VYKCSLLCISKEARKIFGMFPQMILTLCSDLKSLICSTDMFIKMKINWGGGNSLSKKLTYVSLNWTAFSKLCREEARGNKY
jgi:hypothetical protein